MGRVQSGSPDQKKEKPAGRNHALLGEELSQILDLLGDLLGEIRGPGCAILETFLILPQEYEYKGARSHLQGFFLPMGTSNRVHETRPPRDRAVGSLLLDTDRYPVASTGRVFVPH